MAVEDHNILQRNEFFEKKTNFKIQLFVNYYFLTKNVTIFKQEPPLQSFEEAVLVVFSA